MTSSTRRYHARKAAGLCPNCGCEREDKDRILCRFCRAKHSALAKERTVWLKSKGYCDRCGQEKALPGRTKCAACAEATRRGTSIWYEALSPERKEQYRAQCGERTSALRRRRAEAGLCPRCGGEPAEGRIYCAACSARWRTQAAARYARYRAQGLCPRCGREKAEPGRSLCANCAARTRELAQKKKGEP